MPAAPSEDYPITGVCIVADPTKCPPGYELILQSYDNKADCDMWKDSFFRSRVTRYLCYTRIYPLDSGRLNNVMADVTINSIGELPPPGFSLLEKTVDSGEKASRKKQICVKMVPRNNMDTDVITSLIFLSKQKRPPAGYCLVGEMNGLLLCFKLGVVPKETEEENQQARTEASNVSSSAAPTLPYQPPQAQPPTLPYQQPQQHQYQGNQHQQRLSTMSRQDSSLVPSNPMYGVPFRLHSRFQDVNSLHTNNIPIVHYRSAVDIDNEYNYSFRLEQQAQALSPSSPSIYS